QDDGHQHDVHVVDQVGGQELADGGRGAADADGEGARGLAGGRQPFRRAGGPRPARRAAASASAGLASTKWKVVPPFISMEGLGWWVSTKTGVWKTGSSPHQPFHSSSSQGPRCGPNLLRPMISAPIPGPQLLAKASSTPAPPPGSPCIARKVGVSKNQF